MSEFIRPPYLPEVQWPVVPPPPEFIPAIPAPAVPQSAPATAEAKPERITLTGRIGTALRFDTLASGTPRVAFSVAEHLEDGTTQWHSVYATKQFAERIRAKELKKGDLVELAGQKQLVTRKGKDGQPRQVEVIYAYGVKPK